VPTIDLQYLKETVYTYSETGLMAWESAIEKVGDIDTVDANNQTETGLMNEGTITAIVSGTDVSPDDLGSQKSVSTTVPYELQYWLGVDDVLDNPREVERLVLRIMREANEFIENLFFSGLMGADSLTHPTAGAGIASAGGPFFADLFTAPNAQTNLYSTGLGFSALNAVYVGMKNYLLHSGKQWRTTLPMNSLRLLYPPELRDVAWNIANFSGEEYDGTASTTGVNQGIVPVELPKSYDVDDWAVIHRPTSPFVLWLRAAPSIFVQRIGNNIRFTLHFSAVLRVKAEEAGFALSVV